VATRAENDLPAAEVGRVDLTMTEVSAPHVEEDVGVSIASM